MLTEDVRSDSCGQAAHASPPAGSALVTLRASPKGGSDAQKLPLRQQSRSTQNTTPPAHARRDNRTARTDTSESPSAWMEPAFLQLGENSVFVKTSARVQSTSWFSRRITRPRAALWPPTGPFCPALRRRTVYKCWAAGTGVHNVLTTCQELHPL